jgi:hypothetical protein
MQTSLNDVFDLAAKIVTIISKPLNIGLFKFL